MNIVEKNDKIGIILDESIDDKNSIPICIIIFATSGIRAVSLSRINKFL